MVLFFGLFLLLLPSPHTPEIFLSTPLATFNVGKHYSSLASYLILLQYGEQK